MRASAQEWCANGLFANIKVTEEAENVIAVAQFNTNGSARVAVAERNLLGSFESMTEKMAAQRQGEKRRGLVQDGADERIAACARLSTEAAAKCESK